MINVKDIDRIVEENREEAQAFLTECLRTPSVTGDEKEMGQVMTKWVKAAGLDPECYEKTEGRPNIVAKWQGSKPGKQFVFNGHMDVFPPVAGNPGLYGPWSGKVVDGRVYGRGAVDMRSGLCAGLMAIKYLKELGYDPNGNILFTAVSDEENIGASSLLSVTMMESGNTANMYPSESWFVIDRRLRRVRCGDILGASHAQLRSGRRL